MGTTNYFDTFIEVAPDSRAATGTSPPSRATGPTVAELQFTMLVEHPYEFTSDDVLFMIYADRANIADKDRASARAEFFSKGQACLRSSPLGKTYGWGTHHDAEGRVALVALGTPEYSALARDSMVKHTAALRSKRA